MKPLGTEQRVGRRNGQKGGFTEGGEVKIVKKGRVRSKRDPLMKI